MDLDDSDDSDDFDLFADPDDTAAWSLTDLAASADLRSIRDAVPGGDHHAERWDI